MSYKIVSVSKYAIEYSCSDCDTEGHTSKTFDEKPLDVNDAIANRPDRWLLIMDHEGVLHFFDSMSCLNRYIDDERVQSGGKSTTNKS